MSHVPDWLAAPDLQQLFAAARAAGGEVRAVGGCVRDFLMGRDSLDIDLATTLTPPQVMAMAAQQNWKTVPTGIDHGTVTLVLPSRVVEVTTLRRDVATDGRHATVTFTGDWAEDAARRDFTINALYMDADGNLSDFFDGRADIDAQHIRFIGDAVQRITEDGLRILRFFRFLASHGKPPADEAALTACATKKDMIAQLSGERIANEMRKLLQHESPAFALRLMQQSGVAAKVFLTDIDPSRMIRLQMLEAKAGYQTSVWARVVLLAAMTPEHVENLSAHWKLSRHEAQQLKLLAGLPVYDAAAPRHSHTRILRLHGAPAYLDWLLSQAALQPGIDIAPYVHLAHDFTPPRFPVNAADLMARGMKEGKALGEALAELEQRWEMSDYQLTKEALLQHLSE